MPIEQIAFVIPPQIEAGLVSGEFIRHGGVVRDTAGHIVTHLKEVPTPKFEKALAEVREFAKANKVVLVTGTVVAAAVGARALAVSIVKRKKIGEAQRRLDAAVASYMAAIVARDMNLAVIDELDVALADLKDAVGLEENDIVNAEVLESLIRYSREFIEANAPSQLPKAESAQIVSLEDYLRVQKGIFDEAS